MPQVLFVDVVPQPLALERRVEALSKERDALRTAADEGKAKHEAQQKALGVASEARLAQRDARRSTAEADCERLRRDRAAAERSAESAPPRRTRADGQNHFSAKPGSS